MHCGSMPPTGRFGAEMTLLSVCIRPYRRSAVCPRSAREREGIQTFATPPTVNCDMHRQRGFTVLEVVITLVIAALVIAAAAPSMSEFMQNKSRATRINAMVTALNYARSEAVTRSVPVTVCEVDLTRLPPGAVPAACNNDPAEPTSGIFEAGWMVFQDSDPAGNLGVVDTPTGSALDDRVLRVFQPDFGGVATLRGRSGSDDADVGFVTFQGTGKLSRPADRAGTATDAFFLYCDERGDPAARIVELTTEGEVRLAVDTNANGSMDVFGHEVGSDISCI